MKDEQEKEFNAEFLKEFVRKETHYNTIRDMYLEYSTYQAALTRGSETYPELVNPLQGTQPVIVRTTHDTEILAACIITSAIEVGDKITFYSSFKHRKEGKTTTMKYGRWLNFLVKTFGVHIDLDRESDYFRAMHDDSHFELIPNNKPDDWIKAYSSDGVGSCMKGCFAVKSYCTSAFGYRDNGLRLAVSRKNGIVVSRCIVQEKTKSATRVYGDSFLEAYLKLKGYKFDLDAVCESTDFLVTWSGVNGDYVGPYIDFISDELSVPEKPYAEALHEEYYDKLSSIGIITNLDKVKECEALPAFNDVGLQFGKLNFNLVEVDPQITGNYFGTPHHCDRCEDTADEEDLFSVYNEHLHYVGNWCHHCIDNHATWVEHDQEYVEDSAVERIRINEQGTWEYFRTGSVDAVEVSGRGGLYLSDADDLRYFSEEDIYFFPSDGHIGVLDIETSSWENCIPNDCITLWYGLNVYEGDFTSSTLNINVDGNIVEVEFNHPPRFNASEVPDSLKEIVKDLLDGLPFFEMDSELIEESILNELGKL